MKTIKKCLILMQACVMLTGCMANPYKEGIESLEEGDYSKAAEAFTKALEEEKNTADSYRGLGIALWEEQDFEGAYEAFENALGNGSEETATIYGLMGNCAMQMEMYEKALENYEMALSMKDISDELEKEIKYNQIAAYEYSGNIEEAKVKIAEYIEQYPDDDSAVREAEFLETR